MASAGSTSLTTTETVLFDSVTDKNRCAYFAVFNRATSANSALINVYGIHNVGEYYVLVPGQKETFHINENGITHVSAKSDGTASVDYGCTGRALD
jgi:molecular chaperone DnaK (HSP70)